MPTYTRTNKQNGPAKDLSSSTMLSEPNKVTPDRSEIKNKRRNNQSRSEGSMDDMVKPQTEIPSPVKKALTSPSGPPSVLRRSTFISKNTGTGPTMPNLISHSTSASTTNSVQWKLPEAPPVISSVSVRPQDSSNSTSGGQFHSSHHRKQSRRTIKPIPGQNLRFNFTGIGLKPESFGRNGTSSKLTKASMAARVPAECDSRPGVIYFELVPGNEESISGSNNKRKLTSNPVSSFMPTLPVPPSSTLNIMQMPLESPVPVAKTQTVDIAAHYRNLLIPQSPNTPCKVYRKFVDEDARGMVTPSANEAVEDMDLSTASRAMLILSNASASVDESLSSYREGTGHCPSSKSNSVVAPDTPITPSSNGCLDFLAFAATMPTPSNSGEIVSSERTHLTPLKKRRAVTVNGRGEEECQS
mmetsp:Transcript_33363/g.48283  ORF Transcript_33363/g.48283 Transcript_33363/m.48283 type:complete len:414 (-) Transcript_33363:197-1438(-)